MRKYVIFQAEKSDKTDWRNRKLHHTQALTWILQENWDSSNKPLPEPGYRPLEFIRVEQLHDPSFHGQSTHYRDGDWEVVRVETYEHEIGRPYAEFDVIVICTCRYNPINAPLKPMPERQVSLASFGGDKEAYKRWLESEQDKQRVEA
jgi:hypothetical protein